VIANVSLPRSTSEIAIAAAPFAAVLLAIVVPMLLDFGYSALDVEVWSLGGLAGCLALVFGWIDRHSYRTGAVLLAVLFYTVVDLYFMHSDLLSLIVLAGFVAAALSPAHATLRIVSVVFSIMFMTTAFFSSEGSLFRAIESAKPTAARLSQAKVGGAPPPIVHIVLDEFASLSRAPEASSLRALNEEIEADYLKRGFAVFRATRATSGSSAISLSELVAPRGQAYANENALQSKAKRAIFEVPRNKYFEDLKRLGYRISVLQSSHLDFCGRETDACLTYKRAEFIDAALRYEKPPLERLRAAAAVMHARASSMSGERRVTLYGFAIQGLDQAGIDGLTRRSGRDEKIWSPSGVSLRAFDYLDTNFATPQSGEAYFIHLLLPHFPYVLNRDCETNPPNQWRWPLWAPESAMAGTALDTIYAAYGEQVRCTHLRTMRLVDAITKSQGGSQTIFIIHGDHGARIHSKIGHLDETKADEAILVDGLDTFFVIKAPGVTAEVDETEALLQTRFHDLLESYILNSRNR